MNFETFTRELQAVRVRGDQFTQRAREAVEGEAPLPEALEELAAAPEELRVTEEEVRIQNEQLVEGWQTVEADRDHDRALFELAPAAYLVTDRAAQLEFALESRGLIEQAKGVLMERLSLGDQAAFARLRRQARSASRKLTEVAREVVGDRGP